MAIKWLCTGRSEHGYQYKNAEGTLQNSSVMCMNFKAEVNNESEAGSVNELFDTKPILSEAGVEAFIGLQIYPQGFTIYVDNRLSNMEATDIIDIGDATFSVPDFFALGVGDYLTTGNSGSGGDEA